MTDISRREVLAASVTAGVSGLAGCLDSFVEDDEQTAETADKGGDDTDTPADNSDTPADNSDTDDDESTDDSIDVVDVNTETTNTECRSDSEEGGDTDIQGDTVKILGTLHTSNPCFVATADAAVSGTTLEVRINGEQEDEEGGCAACLGAVEYETSVQLSEAGIENVELTHEANGEESAGTASTEQSVTSMSVEAVKTTRASCGQGTEEVTASRDDSTLTIEGSIQAPNPCHEVAVSGLSKTDGVPTVNVGVESTLKDGEMCQQCLGNVAYRVTLVEEEGTVDQDVKVKHSSGFSRTV